MKTFTAGAEQVNITQAAISMQIRQLEDEVGLQLFTRTPRRVILTEAGEHLLRRAQKNFARTRRRACRNRRNCRRGTRTFANRFGFGDVCDYAVAGDFGKAERINFRTPKSRSVPARVRLWSIKLCTARLILRSCPCRLKIQIFKPICYFSDEIVAIAHPTHPLAKEKYISAATLAGEELILGEKGGNTRRMIDDFFAAANVKPNVVMELSRQEAINKMVENNMGVGIAGAKAVAQRR